MFKQQNVQTLFNHLRDELAEYETRSNQETKVYGELLQTRKKDLKNSEVSIIRSGFLYLRKFEISSILSMCKYFKQKKLILFCSTVLHFFE